MNRPSLTTVVLTHPQAGPVDRLLLDAAKHSEEVLVVDNSSAEQKRPYEERHNTRIVRHKLNGDFAKQRNFALTQVRTDWTLFLDSDEVCPPALWAEIREVIDHDSSDAIRLRRLDWFLGRRLEHGEVGRVRLLRCAKTRMGIGRWQRPVHETWEIDTGRVADLQTPLEHRPHPGITEFLGKLHWYASLEPQSRPSYGWPRVMLELSIFPAAKFLQNYLFRGGALDGWPGFVHAACMSYYSLVTRVFLYEAQFAKRP